MEEQIRQLQGKIAELDQEISEICELELEVQNHLAKTEERNKAKLVQVETIFTAKLGHLPDDDPKRTFLQQKIIEMTRMFQRAKDDFLTDITEYQAQKDALFGTRAELVKQMVLLVP